MDGVSLESKCVPFSHEFQASRAKLDGTKFNKHLKACVSEENVIVEVCFSDLKQEVEYVVHEGNNSENLSSVLPLLNEMEMRSLKDRLLMLQNAAIQHDKLELCPKSF